MPKERCASSVPAITVEDAARLHVLAQLKEQETLWEWDQESTGTASTLRLHQYDCAINSPTGTLGYTDLSDRARATMEAVRDVEAGLADMATEMSVSVVSYASGGGKSMSLDHCSAMSESVVDCSGGLKEPSKDDSVQYRAWLKALRAASEQGED